MDHKAKIKLIKSLLKEELVSQKNASFWPREIKLVNQLYKVYPNDAFWDLVGLSFKLNSLAWFLTDDGQKELKRLWFAYNMGNSGSESPIVDLQKFGEDAVIEPQKPKTIADFLNE